MQSNQTNSQVVPVTVIDDLPVKRRQATDLVRPLASSKTLMRQAVSRPSKSLKRQIKVNYLSPRPLDSSLTRTSPGSLANNRRRLALAKRVSRSPMVNHFQQPSQLDENRAVIDARPVDQPTTPPSEPLPPIPVPTQPPADPVEAMMQKALEQATAHEQPAFKPSRKFGLPNLFGSRRLEKA